MYLFNGVYKGDNMKKESLKIAKEVLMDTVAKLDIDAADRTELMINLYNLLDENKYENNIKVLAKKRGKRNV